MQEESFYPSAASPVKLEEGPLNFFKYGDLIADHILVLTAIIFIFKDIFEYRFHAPAQT